VDYTYTHHKAWTGADFGDRMPSDVFKSNVITCFIDDHFGVANVETIGADMVTWECDYPHSDSSWPNSPEHLWSHFEGQSLSENVINKITHENVMRLYSFDPYSTRPREKCTARALRAEVPGHDVSVVSRAIHRGPKATTFGEYIELAKGMNNQTEGFAEEAFTVRR